MRIRSATLVTVILFTFAANASAQEPRPIRLVDSFLLDRVLQPARYESVGWNEGLWWGHGPLSNEQGAPDGFVTIDPATGKVTPLQLDPTALFAEQPGARAGSLEAHFQDPGSFGWNADKSAFITNFANDLWYCEPESESVVRLTTTPGDEVGEDLSPDGSLVAFIHDFDLHVVPVEGGEPLPLTDGGHADLLYGRLDWVYQEEVYGRGNFKGFWWSPDSTRLALLRLDESPVKEFTLVSDTPVRPTVEVTNYPKAGEPNPIATLGIVDVLGGEVRWVELPQYAAIETLIVRVNWHPSGEEVWFQVTDREQTFMHLIAADAETGEARLVFREESECWFEPKAEPMFLRDGEEFLWVSERDGFAHIYRYRADGQLIGRLTEGRFDVEELHHVDEAKGEVLFSSDRGDFTQRHLFRVGLAGGEPERVTEGGGWHEVEISSDGQWFLDRSSTLTRPESMQFARVDGAGKAFGFVQSRGLPLERFGVQLDWVKVPAKDGFEMEGYVLRPAGFDASKKHPVLCHIYAGPHAPKALDRWRWRDFLWHARMAQKGYAIFVVDPRSASGKGRASACAAWRKFGQTELQDLEDAVAWLLAQGGYDDERVGIWGWSYGGYQTLYNLTHSKVWDLGVAVNPVTDWRFYDTIYTERYMGTPQSNPEGYAKGSVLGAAENLDAQLLLVHATMDDNVHMQNSMAFIWELQRAGKQFRFLPYPRVRHGIEDISQQLHLFTAIESFVDEHFDGGAAR